MLVEKKLRLWSKSWEADFLETPLFSSGETFIWYFRAEKIIKVKVLSENERQYSSWSPAQ